MDDLIFTDYSNDRKKKKDKKEAAADSKSQQSPISTGALSKYLIENNIISEDQLKVAETQQAEAEDSEELGNVLVDLGFITGDTLSDILSRSGGVETFNFKKGNVTIDSELLDKLPQKSATKYKLLPMELSDEKVLRIVTYDVNNIIAFDDLKKIYGADIEIIPYYAPEVQIREAIDKYYGFELSLTGILREIEQMKDHKVDDSRDDYVNPNVRLVDAILTDAVKREASDIHFEPESNFVRLRYRIDGKLQQILTFHKRYWPSVMVRLKIISEMNIAETRNPQDGRLSFKVLGRDVDFRVSSQPTVHGENIVFRILDKAKALVELDKLGMSKEQVELIKKLLHRPEGIFFVTGSTGSGKTTTLYSILNYINNLEKNIMTLEDPVEYKIPIIRQSNITHGTKINFADGVRSLLRQDPDVIFVGETRDEATAAAAMRAAMTGHQVYSTLHTNDSLASIQRMLDLGVSNNILAGSIICCIAQRLMRKLCTHCKQGYSATAYEKKILGIKSSAKLKLYKQKGCEKCSFTGFKGRIGLYEILTFNQELNSLIGQNADPVQLEIAAHKIPSFKKLSESGITRVVEGMSSLEELISVVDLTDRL